jgi:hypothetical protein
VNGTNQFLVYAADVTCRKHQELQRSLSDLDLDDASQPISQEPLDFYKGNLKVIYFHFHGSIVLSNILICFRFLKIPKKGNGKCFILEEILLCVSLSPPPLTIRIKILRL